MPIDNFAPNESLAIIGYVNFITAGNKLFITAQSFILTVLGEGTVSTPSGTLTVSGVATLQNSYWSDIPLIREGFVIVDNETGKKAYLSEDPINQSKSVKVLIEDGFPKKTYTSGSWSLYVPEYTNLDHYLPRKVKNSTTLIPSWLNVLEREVLDEIDDSVKRLLSVREWDNVDIHLLPRLKNTLGSFIDTNSFSILELRRLIQELPYFYTVSSTDQTIDFLGYILNTVFKYKQLWTKNYIDFISKDLISTNDESFYPTAHISLEYDALRFTSVDVDNLKRQFYIIAPTPVVIEEVVGSVSGEVDLSLVSYSKVDTYTINKENKLVEKDYYPPSIEYRQAYDVGYYIIPGEDSIYTNTLGKGSDLNIIDTTNGGTSETYYNPQVKYQDIFG